MTDSHTENSPKIKYLLLELSGFPKNTPENSISDFLSEFVEEVRSIHPKNVINGRCTVKLVHNADVSGNDIIDAINSSPFEDHTIKAKKYKDINLIKQQANKQAEKQGPKRAPMLFENEKVPVPLHPNDFKNEENNEKQQHHHADDSPKVPRQK